MTVAPEHLHTDDRTAPPPAPPSAPGGAPAQLAGRLQVVPWTDPVIDQLGHDPRSAYVERFWLAILGPSATWLVRRLGAGLDRAPEGFPIDLAHTARSLGLGTKGGRHTPFLHTVDRTCEFGLARYLGTETLAVRRRIPPLTRHQVARLPRPLRDEHTEWLARAPAVPDPEEVRRRARRLALSLLELGEDASATERQLHRWRFHPALAHEAVVWACGQHGTPPPAPTPAPAPAGAGRPPVTPA